MLRKVNGRLWGPIAMDWWRLWIVISLIFWYLYCQITAYNNFRWRCMTATVLDDGHWSSKSFMEYICDNQVHIVWQSWVWIVSCTSFAIRCFLGDAAADQRERDLLLQTISSPVVCMQWNSCARPDGYTCFTSSHPSDLKFAFYQHKWPGQKPRWLNLLYFLPFLPYSHRLYSVTTFNLHFVDTIGQFKVADAYR